MFKKMNILRKNFGKNSNEKSDTKNLEKPNSTKKIDKKLKKNLFNSTENEEKMNLTTKMNLSLDEDNLKNVTTGKEMENMNINDQHKDKIQIDNNLHTYSKDKLNSSSTFENKLENEKPLSLIDDSDEVEENFNITNLNEEPFPETVSILETENGSKVYLIGTIHFSEESCLDVEKVIQRVKPNIVFLEICEQRINSFLIDDKKMMEIISNFSFESIKPIIKEYGIVQGFIQILFLRVSKKIAEQTGILPGSEIRRALLESKKIPNCVFQLGDRPFNITFRRAIGFLTLWQKIKIVFTMLFTNFSFTKEEIEKYKKSDILETYLEQLGSEYPSMKTVLVDERDKYLAYSLQSAVTSMPKCTNAIYTKNLRESRNSLASVEQQLINCKHELKNFKRIKSLKKNSNLQQSKDKLNSSEEDKDIEIYEKKFKVLQENYSLMQQQVLLHSQKLNSFSQNLNSKDFGPTTVVGVVGMGHVNGIIKYWGKVKKADIKPLMEIPETTLETIIFKKVVYYSFYSILTYGLIKYALPNTLKESVLTLSKNSIQLSKNLFKNYLMIAFSRN